MGALIGVTLTPGFWIRLWSRHLQQRGSSLRRRPYRKMGTMAAQPGPRLGSAFGLRMLLATLLQAVSAFGAEFSSEACRELGYSSNLLCSSCDLLGQFSLLQLEPDCKGCCQEEAQFESKKLYAGAILEVCG